MANESKLATTVSDGAARSQQAPNHGVTRDDGSTSWQTVDLSAFAGRYVTFVSDSACYVCVTENGFSTGSIVIDSASLALGDNVATLVPAGSVDSFVVGKDLNEFHVRTVSADPAVWSLHVR